MERVKAGEVSYLCLPSHLRTHLLPSHLVTYSRTHVLTYSPTNLLTYLQRLGEREAVGGGGMGGDDVTITCGLAGLRWLGGGLA